MGADTDQWRLAAELFDQLVDLPPERRASELAARCGGDRELAQAVRRLIAGHERALASRGRDSGRNVAVDLALREFSQSGDLAAGTGAGAFRVLHALGAGGMGQVYLAERSIDGRAQRVALKVPRADQSAEAGERFRRERAILATLQHPTVARLIDAGELADGRPYLAMEYVEGRSIVDYCREQRLDLSARIRLVLAVLAAVQHAHERLILHRDIKPANVMVDTGGRARLLDFGIGKELDAAPSQSTIDGMRYFSLASAAPEQIAGKPTSAATDVYAVGVLLYQLLAGCAPIHFDGLSPHAALERALNLVPPLASAAVAALAADAAQAKAAERRLRPAGWVAGLRGDIDQILARALRKEPSSRYPTAEAFAADLRAVLELRPISERRSERGYRLSRFLRRHALAVALTGTLALSLAAFLTLTLLQSAALRRARDDAEQRRAQSEQVTGFLKNLFRQSDPLVARGRELSARDLLDRGVADLANAQIDRPQVRAELLETLADIQFSLGEFDTAYELARSAYDLRLDDLPALDRSREQLARLEVARGHPEQALAHLDSLLAGVAGPPGADFSDQQLRWWTLRVAATAGREADTGATIDAYQQIAAECLRRFGHADRRTLDARRRLASALGAAGRTAEEAAQIEELTRHLRLDQDSDDPELAAMIGRRASALRNLGRLDEARDLAAWALRVHRKVYGQQHPQVISALARLAGIEESAGRLDAAEEYYRSALEMALAVLPSEAPLLLLARANYASFLHLRRGDAAAAAPLLEAVVVGAESTNEPSLNLAIIKVALAHVYVDQDRPADARVQFEGARRIVLDLDPTKLAFIGKIEAQLNCLLPPDRRPQGSAQQLRQAIDLLRSRDPEDESLPRMQACAREA